MPSESLHAPWRMDYIRGLTKESAANQPAKKDECFFCQAITASDLEDRKRRGVLWVSDLSVVMINLFPYTNGHLLIAPRRHIADLESLSDPESQDLMRQTIEGIKLLKRAISPQGFNIGMNLGRCAGAGVPGHLHQHVVPRWGGDTNFMTIVADIRRVPQAMGQLWEELMTVREEIVAKPE